MLNELFAGEPSKKLILSNKEEFDEIIEKEAIQPYILNKHEPSFTILLRADFNDSKCPRCDCHTISPILNVDTNKFIDSCANCKMEFQLTINQ